MKQLHVITGLPRAGSTLLCNILNQNPKFCATSTSTLPGLINGISNYWGQSIEIKNLLEKEKEITEDRMQDTMRSLIQTWYARNDGRDIIFDKSRGWVQQSLILKQLYPNAKIIICIRDLRNIFSSMEKQHRKNPLLNVDGDNSVRLLFDRANRDFDVKGIIGNPLLGISDILRREPTDTIFLQYEALASIPSITMQNLYTQLELPYFKHDFKNVENTSTDPDGYYLHKFPHKGCGKIEKPDLDEWKQYISPDIASMIMQKFQWYNLQFGYGNKKTQPMSSTTLQIETE